MCSDAAIGSYESGEIQIGVSGYYLIGVCAYVDSGGVTSRVFVTHNRNISDEGWLIVAAGENADDRVVDPLRLRAASTMIAVRYLTAGDVLELCGRAGTASLAVSGGAGGGSYGGRLYFWVVRLF
jgi:hypothetical protein